MNTNELIRLMPSQYKRVTEGNPLRVGHHIPLIGYWTKEEGYVKKQSLTYENESLACPIIAIVKEKFGNNINTLTITAKTSVYKSTQTKTQGDYTINTISYKPSGETITATLSIPRHTRPWATYLVLGLGRSVYEIESVTSDSDYETGKVEFYALASNGSKIIYWLGLHRYAEQLRTMLRPWIAPSKCKRCNGTGIEPDTNNDLCNQCNGYKYSGYSAEKYIQKMLGADVGISRETITNWENMTQSEYNMIDKFINKAWTQKWWVTPTENEIKRIFAHFYNIDETEIRITKRYNLQEPVWDIFLPEEIDINSPFGTLTQSDRDLLKYIAESMTPAGVSVFMGFYKDFFFGDLEDLGDELFLPINDLQSSIEPQYELWGMPRWDFYNGWTNATVDFEDKVLKLDHFGNVGIFNANDANRHVCRFVGNSYVSTGMACSTGYFDIWIHPQNSIRCGILNNLGEWMLYVQYEESGFFDHLGNLLTLATPDSDYHLSVDFVFNPGYYYGNPDNFNDEDIGTKGTNINFVDTVSVNELPIIIKEIDNHKKVIKQHSNGAAWSYLYHNFPGGNENAGIREFWLAGENTAAEHRIQFLETWNARISFRILNDKFSYQDGVAGWTDICDITDNIMFHVKIQWYADNTFDCYINNTKEIDGGVFTANMIAGINKFYIGAFSSDAYIDSWGDPNDPTYNEGDNLELSSDYTDMNVYIMKELLGTSIEHINRSVEAVYFKVENLSGDYSFVDAIGLSTDINYQRYDNWQRLHEFGWGLNHVDSLSGETNLIERYFRRDRPIIF